MDKGNEENRALSWQKRQLILALVLTAVLAVVLGTLAWLSYNRGLQTVTQVHMPQLTLLGGADSIPIDLGEIFIDKENGFRDYMFSVKSRTDNTKYYLQLAHTTNIPLTYTIYPAERKDTQPNGNYVQEGDVYFSYSDPLPGAYLNLNLNADTKLANGDKHEETYGTYSNVQKNAEPLYWRSSLDNPLQINQSERKYFVLKVSWEEGVANNKETDMIYLTARTLDDNGNTPAENG